MGVEEKGVCELDFCFWSERKGCSDAVENSVVGAGDYLDGYWGCGGTCGSGLYLFAGEGASSSSRLAIVISLSFCHCAYLICGCCEEARLKISMQIEKKFSG